MSLITHRWPIDYSSTIILRTKDTFLAFYLLTLIEGKWNRKLLSGNEKYRDVPYGPPYMKDIHGSKKKKTPKRPQCRQYSLHLIYFFYWGQLQGPMSVRSMKVSTNQWHNYGSVHLAIFDHLLVLIVIFNMREVAMSPKYNFEKLMRKLTISYFYWLKLIGSDVKCY